MEQVTGAATQGTSVRYAIQPAQQQQQANRTVTAVSQPTSVQQVVIRPILTPAAASPTVSGVSSASTAAVKICNVSKSTTVQSPMGTLVLTVVGSNNSCSSGSSVITTSTVASTETSGSSAQTAPESAANSPAASAAATPSTATPTRGVKRPATSKPAISKSALFEHQLKTDQNEALTPDWK